MVTQVQHSYPVCKKQAAVDIKTYLLKVTRNNAAVAMDLKMPRGKEITYAAVVAFFNYDDLMWNSFQLHTKAYL